MSRTQTISSAPLTPYLVSSPTAKTSDPKARFAPCVVPGRLRLKIDDRWYDLTNWGKHHPGGEDILTHLNGQDATDAFYSLHSKEAIARLSKMSSSPATPNDPKPTQVALNFRKFRQQLEQEGWFERSFFWELFYLSSIYVLASLGTYFALVKSSPILAIICIGLAMQQAGWIGHDYVHGRGNAMYYMGRFSSGVINAFSPTWWSNKHNTHHVYTNYIGVDEDIHNDPVFHLLFPHDHNDVWFRKFQHFYFVPVASFLYVSWRIQSFQYAFERKHWSEIFFMAINYFWLYQLGLTVAFGSVFFGGFLVAVIVTATHQSEEMYDGSTPEAINSMPYSYVECQFNTTRDARTTDPFMEWLWGGMQYQLEHHLFPTMPKYYYSSICDRVEKFAKENGLDYRVDTMFQIWRRNYDTLRYFAQPTPAEVKGKAK